MSQLNASYNSVAARCISVAARRAVPHQAAAAPLGGPRRAGGRAQCVCVCVCVGFTRVCVVQRRVASPRCRDSEWTKVRFLGWRGCGVIAHPSQKTPAIPAFQKQNGISWIVLIYCLPGGNSELATMSQQKN